MLLHSEIQGTHEPGSRGQGCTLEEFYQLLKSLPRQVRQNYFMTRNGEDVTGLVSRYDLIAHEKLNIKGMVRGSLAKSIMDAAWGQLIYQLTYKAEEAGRYAIDVNPRNTSINCSVCGARVQKKLADRRHLCACGADLDRDHNAAINILALGMSAVARSAKRMDNASPKSRGKFLREVE